MIGCKPFGHQVFLKARWSIVLVAALVFGVACGTSSDPASTPATEQTPANTAAPQPLVSSPTLVPKMSKETSPSGKLTVLIPGWGNERFDYGFSGGGAGNAYGRLLFGPLVATNENLEILPGIAKNWRLSDDGRTWTLTIRDGVKFHDGTELTAEDVFWSFRHTWDPQALDWVLNSGVLSVIAQVDQIEQTSPDSVSITLKGVDPGFLTDKFFEAGSSWLSLMPKRDALHNEEAELAYDKDPVGNGPMKLVRHVQGSQMEFERFDDYFYQPMNGFSEDRRVNFGSLDLVVAPEEATRVAAIRAGEADLTIASLDTREQVKAGGGRLVFGREGAYFRVMLIGCFEEQFPCHAKGVRQALNYAIDKEVLREFYGPEVMEVKGWNVVTPSTIGYSPDLKPFPFDPDKARELLADAGYPGGEGFGKLIVNTWTSKSIPFLPESALVAADSWKKELGLDVEVKVGDETALKKELATDKLRGQILWRDNETRLDASSNVLKAYGTPGVAYQFHKTLQLYDQVQKGISVIDPNRRPEALNKVYMRLLDESYELAIGYVNIPWAVGPRIGTWKPYPLASHPTALHTLTLK